MLERQFFDGCIARFVLERFAQRIICQQRRKRLDHLSQIIRPNQPTVLAMTNDVFDALIKAVIACPDQGIEDVIRHGEKGWLIRPDNLAWMIEARSTLLANES